jgi:hypothetical protein
LPIRVSKNGALARLPWKGLVVVALVLAGTAIMASLFWKLRHDDAYVTLVFARNLASGGGYAFNPGEPVFGATSPLHVFLLALLYLFVGNALPTATVVVGAFGLSMQGVLIYALVRRFSPLLAALLGLLVWAGMADGPTWLALETNLFVALVLAVLWAQNDGRPYLCGIFLGLAFLCRYDGAVLIPVLVLEARLRGKPLPRRELLSAFVIVAPWLVGATIYFGSFLPQTLLAKQGVASAPEYLGHYFVEATRHPATALFFGHVGRLGQLIVPLAWISGLVLVLRHLPELRGYLIFSICLFAAYAAIGPGAIQHWHMYPLMVASSILQILGTLGWLVLAVKSRMAKAGSRWLVLLPLLPGLVAVVLTFASSRSLAQGLERSFWLGYRQKCYEAVADWIDKHVEPGQVFIAGEIGTLGYLTRERMVDPHGLINETNDFPQTRNPYALLKLFHRYRPTMALVDSISIGRWLEKETDLRIVKVFPWGSPWSTLLLKPAR